MSAPIGPGDFVECRPQFYCEKPSFVSLTGPWPRPGCIYQVREVGTKPGNNQPAIRLVGIVASYPGHPDCWWPTKHFRPVYTPNAELLADLLRRSKEPLRTETPEPVGSAERVAVTQLREAK